MSLLINFDNNKWFLQNPRNFLSIFSPKLSVSFQWQRSNKNFNRYFLFNEVTANNKQTKRLQIFLLSAKIHINNNNNCQNSDLLNK
jgi:hypothetical protein